jgi:hypothetical protein
VNPLELVVRGTLLGVGGAVLMDAWALLLRRGFGIRGLDYALLGRWVGHLPRGQFSHASIAAASPVRGERALGWIAHYAIAVGFAMLLLVLAGPTWSAAPTLVAPMLVALGTIVAPWFVMQPAMGLGIAASRAPRPGAARLRNVATHVMYGLGVYTAALVVATVWPWT